MKAGLAQRAQSEIEEIKEETVPEKKNVQRISDTSSRKAPALDRRTTLSQGRSKTISWKPDLNAYPYPELRAVTFATDDDLKKAVRLIWSRQELHGLPREPAGIRTMVMPADAVSFFGGLDFSVFPVVSVSELSTDVKRKLRKEQGHH